MDQYVQHLDDLIAAGACDARIEVSLTLDELSAALSDVSSWSGDAVLGQLYSVDGLGLWRAFSIDFDRWGTFVFAAPEHDPVAGVSAWYASAKMSAPRAARLISAVAPNTDAMFLDPETGDFIEPQAAVPTWSFSIREGGRSGVLGTAVSEQSKGRSGKA